MAGRFPSTNPGAAAAAPGAVGVPTSLVRTPTVRSRAEARSRSALFLAAILSVVTTILIVLSLLRETIAFFGDVPIRDYLFGTSGRRCCAATSSPSASSRSSGGRST